MEEYSTDVSVIDVYEIASAIGKEFERIIDICGTEVVTTLMTKVIGVLESLETLASKSDRDNILLEDLKNRILKLEHERHIRAEDRLKFEKELEQIEEDWRKESNHLFTVIAKLQEDNKRLTSIIDNKTFTEQESSVNSEDVNVVHQLQNQVEKLREKIKSQNTEINAKIGEIDTLGNQVEHLKTALVDFKRKHRVHVSQIHGFIEEKAKLLIEIQDQRREILLLHQRLGIVQKENEDLVKSNIEVPDLNNKILYDVDDPNRPRFTSAELKEILHERNELKAKLNELQDEMSLYRQDDSIEIRPEVATEFDFSEEELPVQGPLPLEPDDAPWKKSESGIRRLFRKLFNENSVNPVKRVTVPIFSPKNASSLSSTTSVL